MLNGSIDVRDGGNKVSLSENTCIPSDTSSSSDSLGITHTLERLNLPRIIDLICSAEVSKKGLSSTSEGDPRVGVDHSNRSDISEVVSVLAHLLLATSLTFFYSICSGLSTRCTNLAHCAVKV